MQLFICPFCGPRDETEFRFLVEAGKSRPEPAAAVSDADWSAYLHLKTAPKGAGEEIWIHLPCGEFFTMTRDTVTRAVISAAPLSEKTP